MPDPVQIRTISTHDNQYRAVLTLSPPCAQVEVTMWYRDQEVGRWALACPWHVALDEVYALVTALGHASAGVFSPKKPYKWVYDELLGRVVQVRRR